MGSRPHSISRGNVYAELVGYIHAEFEPSCFYNANEQPILIVSAIIIAVDILIVSYFFFWIKSD